MSHTIKHKSKLIGRIRRIKGQIEAVERALESEIGCADVLMLVASVRGAVNGLTAELLEDHIRHHVVDPAHEKDAERARGAADLIEVCQHRIHHDPFQLSKDGNFSWEEVECLGACVNAPMVLIWKDTYEDLTKESFGKVLDGFAAGNPPKPGPQIDRQFSAPAGGPTTLKETT
ncbi:MAG TPA: hypothetical protein DEH75_10510 [Bradyrhizobium sp.]|nr:hypothetical protein [Bradyrhizobium sp.]